MGKSVYSGDSTLSRPGIAAAIQATKVIHLNIGFVKSKLLTIWWSKEQIDDLRLRFEIYT